MPALRSSVLIVMHPDPRSIAFGADFAADYEQALKSISEFNYPVIVVPSSSHFSKQTMQTMQLLKHVNEASPLSQRVLIQNDTEADPLREMINNGSIFRVLSSFADAKFDHTIQEALEEYRLLQQNAKLVQLVNEQNERLKKLTADLEERVEARRRSLDDAKEKLLTTNHRVEALHRALVAIHRARSIGEMERLINTALSEAMGLSWTRILFQSQGHLQYQGRQNSLDSAQSNMGALTRDVVALHNAPLMRGKETLGYIYFARDAKSPFSRDENGFLGQIADSVALAIDRLTKLEQSENLKRQWEDTFDAILEPVSLIDTEFNVIRINRSFASSSGTEPEQIIGRKCHEALFSRPVPCEGCKIKEFSTNKPGTPGFRLKNARNASGQSVIYDVFSQEIPLNSEGRSFFVNMYRDVSAQLRFERQILETAKMAEFGTIGSSIAHELNNPLGGMLSFLQLIKMDLKGTEPWYADIAEMEAGAKRCRDIVESLLGFTRKSSQDKDELIDLREVVDQALKITELQTRAMGIRVEQERPSEPYHLRGSFNFLAQAIRNFLQNAQESIAKRLKSGDRTQGLILVKLHLSETEYFVEISDNGGSEDRTHESPESLALGLAVATQILAEFGGKVEMTSSKGSSVSAKISLPRPVFDS
jgi:two-component system NtrC family sensor kinase